MAIEILERGVPENETVYTAACRGCKSVVRWTHADARYVHAGDQRDGPFTQIDCPVCKKRLITGYPPKNG